MGKFVPLMNLNIQLPDFYKNIFKFHGGSFILQKKLNFRFKILLNLLNLLILLDSAKSRALVPYVPSCLGIIIACPRALVPEHYLRALVP